MAASRSKLTNRYPLSSMDGLIDLECSTRESAQEVNEVTSVRTAAAMEVLGFDSYCEAQMMIMISWRIDNRP